MTWVEFSEPGIVANLLKILTDQKVIFHDFGGWFEPGLAPIFFGLCNYNFQCLLNS